MLYLIHYIHGLPVCPDDTQFKDRVSRAQSLIDYNYPSFSEYFQSRVVPMIRGNFNTNSAIGNSLMAPCNNWTKNNLESINAMLKYLVSWTPQQFPELVSKLYQLVQAQQLDAQRALTGQGDYHLAPPFRQFTISVECWSAFDKKKRSNYVKKISEKPPSKESILFVTLYPTHKGKKQWQKRAFVLTEQSEILTQ